MIEPSALAAALTEYLPKQRWYAGSDAPARVVVERLEVLHDEWPALVWAVVAADGVPYQLLLGVRVGDDDPPDFLHGHDDAVLGTVPTHAGPGLTYDGTLDPGLALVLLDCVTKGGEQATLVRPIGAEQSNTSLVFDDRLVLKVFRRLHDGPNPDVEVTTALATGGFPHVAEPAAAWERDGRDLAIVQRYLTGSTDGWSLALASLRDLFATGLSPSESGGDFGGEAWRLGEVTARLHLALANAFGQEHPTPPGWVKGIADAVRAFGAGGGTGTRQGDERIERFVDRMEALQDWGAAIRVHGDFHLGQALRTDTGWYIVDFEGEPSRPLGERRRLSSPLKDVAGMLRSFHYAAEVGRSERDAPGDDALVRLGEAWEQRNRRAFLDGYLATSGIDELLPTDVGGLATVLRSFELEKAVYEVAYETDHRPDWVAIPRGAIDRLLSG
ncbi:MAG TPA: hypothetical protein VM030_02360 [Acidimicrobiales bacterium]|nr:hypothetical protein [Acidimicrobiales bacterium]